MKILIISPTFPPRKFGGVTNVSYNYAKNLVRKGHDVTVYTTDINDKYSRIPVTKEVKNINGINVYYFMNFSNTLAFNNYYLPLGFVGMVKKNLMNFDVIHLHDFRSFQAITIHHYARKYGVPYILQAHGALVSFIQKRLLKKVFDRLWGYRILRGSSKVIALTETESAQYMSMGVIKEKIVVIPNGIDLADFDKLPEKGEFRNKYHLSSIQPIVLYVGRIIQTKGIDLLVRAFASFSNGSTESKLVLVGPDLGHLPLLFSLIERLKIKEKVLITGPLYGSDKLEAYVDATVFVTPSYDGFPITFLEACACGLPIITTQVGDRLDWLDGEVGLVVAYDTEQLSNAIANMIGDEKMRKEFSQKGKMLVYDKFNWEKIAGQIEKVYLSCLSG